MGYDRYIARPAVEAAYRAILAERGKFYATPDKVFTNKDVQEVIGKAPAKTLTDPDGNTVEIYQWRAGLPIRTHDLFAIYEQKDGKLVFQDGGTGNYEQIAAASKNIKQETTVITPTQEDLAEYARADRESNSGNNAANTFSDAEQESLEQANEDEANKKAADSENEPETPEDDSAANAASPAQGSEPSKPQPSFNASTP